MFQTKHKLEFGLKIVKWSSLRVVETMQCQFCVHNGRETRVGPRFKRKRTNYMKVYTLPFRPKQYRQHLTSQHTDDWTNYKLLDLESKNKYFDDKEVCGINSLWTMPRTTLNSLFIDPILSTPSLVSCSSICSRMRRMTILRRSPKRTP